MTVVYSGASDERDHWEQGLLKRFRENPEALRLAEEAGLRAEHFQYEVNAEAFLDFKQRRHPGKGRPIDECERVGLVGEVLGLMGITGEGSYGAAPDRTTPRGQHDTKRNAAKAKPAAPASDRQTRQGNSARRPSTEAREPEGQNHGAKRITWFFKHVLLARDLSPFEVRVAGALVGFVNRKSGATFVSQRKLAGLLGASLRQVQRALDALVAKGYLAKNEQHGPGRSNLYRLTLPAKAPAEATADEDEPKPVAESAPSEMDDSYKDLPGGDDEIPF